MAAKINWHRYGTKLRHCHLMYIARSSEDRSSGTNEPRTMRPSLLKCLQPISTWRDARLRIITVIIMQIMLQFQKLSVLFSGSSRPHFPTSNLLKCLWILAADTVNCFKNRLDQSWSNQEILYNHKADLHGIGNRSILE